jgi:hypothetical protein
MKHCAMETVGSARLTLALVGGEWSASRPSRFTPGTHFVGGG